MRCKRHTVDPSRNSGVCASCLRERLLSLAASAAITAAAEDNYHHQTQKPPFLIFPRSVSPYITRRKSDPNRRFITTPQVDIGYSCKDFESNRSFKSRKSKFSSFSKFFRSRSEDFDYNTKSSWISTIFPRSKKQPTNEERIYCRGMSPARDTESPGRVRSTPATKTPGRVVTGLGKSMSGMGLCLSPLVRVSPNCPFRRRLRLPLENVVSGEVTVTEKPHISAAASFCGNRSKKLVDLGRVDRRR